MLNGRYAYSLLQYDWLEGTFHWKVNKRPMLAGDCAGFLTADGRYWKICIDRKQYPANKLAWLLVTGVYPTCIVDHRDGNGLNNRFINLRLANSTQNSQNRKRDSRNSSGHTGVSWYKAYDKWSACIHIEKRKIFLGYYLQLEDAIAVRDDASRKYFGEFARIS